MKQISESISYSTKSLPGRWTKVSTMGCILALVFLGATSALPKAKGTARPFKENGIISFAPDGTFGVVGNATHLGNFVGEGIYYITGVSDGGSKVHFYVAATWTAANGKDAIDIEMPDWVADYSVTPPTSTGVVNIIGGTGRFVNASGLLFGEISPAAVTPGVPNDLTSEGIISY